MSLAQQIRDQTQAVRFKKHVFKIRRRLDKNKNAEAAQTFGAESSFLGSSKKLIETAETTYQQVIRTIARARKYWQAMSVPFPSKGIRLIRKELVAAFEQQMETFKAELDTAITAMVQQYPQIKQRSQLKLGNLFNPSDYPGSADFGEQFWIEVEYPSVEPPASLAELNPALYEQERARVAAKFEEAMATVEQAMAGELQGLIGHLCDKLAPQTGKGKKGLSQKAIDGLTEFVQTFKTIHVGDESQLSAIISQVDALTKGIDPDALKADPSGQGQLFNTMTALKENLDSLIVDQPTRKIKLEDEED